MASHTFPLLRLPESARNNVLRNFGVFQLLLDISLISERSKLIVKSLNLQINGGLSFKLGDSSGLTIAHRSIQWRYAERLPNDFFESDVSLIGMRSSWRTRGSLLKYYIGHFLDVLNKSRLDLLSFDQDENQFGLDVLRRGLPMTAQINVMKNYSAEHLVRIVANYPYVGKFVYSDFKPLEKKLPKVFIQNFDLLSSDQRFYTWHLSLDELLEINSAQIQIRVADISENVLNQFLKLWVKGASLRLKFLSIRYPRELKQEAILRRIPHQVVEKDRQFEIFHEDRDSVRRITVNGGVDVRRKNGTVGTIVFEDDDFGVKMSLYIWN